MHSDQPGQQQPVSQPGQDVAQPHPAEPRPQGFTDHAPREPQTAVAPVHSTGDGRSIDELRADNERLERQALEQENARLQARLEQAQAGSDADQGLTDADIRRIEHPEEFDAATGEPRDLIAEEERRLGNTANEHEHGSRRPDDADQRDDAEHRRESVAADARR